VYNFTLFFTQNFFCTTFVQLFTPFPCRTLRPFCTTFVLSPPPPTLNLLFHIVSSLSSTMARASMARATKKAKTTATGKTTTSSSSTRLLSPVPPAAAARSWSLGLFPTRRFGFGPYVGQTTRCHLKSLSCSGNRHTISEVKAYLYSVPKEAKPTFELSYQCYTSYPL
jgi:hypothetical protein